MYSATVSVQRLYHDKRSQSWLMPMSWCVGILVAKTQRLALEVEALWTFYSNVRHKFTEVPSSSMPKVNIDLVRCFTTDIGVAQQLQ